MAAPVGIINSIAYQSPSVTEDTPKAAAGELRKKLSNTQLLQGTSINLNDAAQRKKHLDLGLFLMNFRGSFTGSSDPAAIEASIKAFQGTEAYKSHQADYDKVLVNIRTQLGELSTTQNQALAALLLKLDVWPKVQTPAPAPQPAPPPADAAAGDAEGEGEEKKEKESKDKDQFFSVRAEIASDWPVLGTAEALGNRVSPLVSTLTHVDAKGSVTFSGAGQVWSVGAGVGAARLKSFPGPKQATYGTMVAGEGRVGLVDQISEKYSAAGLSLRVAGIRGAAGIQAPPRAVQLGFFSTNDLLSFDIKDKCQAGIALFTNNNAYYTLNGNKPLPAELSPEDAEGNNIPSSGLAVSGNFYPATQNPWVNLSMTCYPNGIPKRGESDPTRPLSLRETLPTTLGILARDQVFRVRTLRTIQPFINNKILFGYTSLSGLESSRSQFDTLGLGLFAFGAGNGLILAQNSAAEAKILRYGSWASRGVLLAAKLGDIIPDAVLAARARSYPAPGNPVENSAVDDIKGWAGKMNLARKGIGVGLTGVNVALDEIDPQKNKKAYYLVNGALTVLGLGFSFFSAPIAGSKCTRANSRFLGCSQGSIANSEEGLLFQGPEDSFDSRLDREFPFEARKHLIGETGFALAITGGKRIAQPMIDGIKVFLKDLKAKARPEGRGAHSQEIKGEKPVISGDVSAGPTGVNFGLRGRF